MQEQDHNHCGKRREIKDLKLSVRSDKELRDDALNMALSLIKIFGHDNFFAEVQYHGIDLEKEIYPKIAELARELNIKLVATNDVHMAERSDLEKRTLLRNFGKVSQKEPKWSAPIQGDSELYYKTGDEKAAMLSEILPEDMVNEAMNNIELIADQCNLELSNAKHYPHFDNAKNCSERCARTASRSSIRVICGQKSLLTEWSMSWKPLTKWDLTITSVRSQTLSSMQKRMEKTQLK